MIWFLLALMLGTMIIGVPILLSIALVGYVGVAAVPDLVLPLFAQKMFAQLDSFTLLALPYFILAGALMSASGMSQQLVDFSRVLVGHLRAGLAHAAVVASMIFAGISGSSTADASAIAAIVIPTMKKSGYKAGFAAALIATAGTIGAIIPPSMVMVVYGSIAQVSIGGLFLGGIVPGILVGLFLMATIKIYSGLPDYPELRVTHGRFEWRAVGRSLLTVWPALMGPVIIVGGILSGIFTANESASIAVIWSFFVTMFIYKDYAWRDLPKLMHRTVKTVTVVMILIGFAASFGYLMTLMQVPYKVTAFFTSVSDNRFVILMLINIMLLVLGCLMDMSPLILICTPILLPVVKLLGVDPVHFGMIIMVNLGIGLITPPVGTVLFVGSAVSKLSMGVITKAMKPFFAVLFAVLMLVTYVPAISLWLPRLLGL